MTNHGPLGEPTDYPDHYDASLLYPIPRQTHERKSRPASSFFGSDQWTAYELSWLTPTGKPDVAIGRFTFPFDSPRLIESKSLKLYLNSFNNETIADQQQLLETLIHDLGEASGAPVIVELQKLEQDQMIMPIQGICIDDSDIHCRHFQPTPTVLKTDTTTTRETLYSHLLRSNCPVTGQPDWGSLLVHYHGPKIQRPTLLQYLVSYRNHSNFHEHCLENIFLDLLDYCSPLELTVEARYTRRGGLDINPLRSTLNPPPKHSPRLSRQ